MSKDAFSSVKYRLKPFLFTHSTIVDMYHFLSDCAMHIDQQPYLVSLYDRNHGESKTLKCNLPEQYQEVLDYLNSNFRTVVGFELLLNTRVQNGHKKISYEIVFDKHTNGYDNAVIHLNFNDVHVSGRHIAFFLLRASIARGYQPDSFDDFVIPSCDVYNLAKEWMNVLQAEECWGGDTTEDFSPYFYSGNFYRYSDFRFRRNGPQYVDISLEDRQPYTWEKADEMVRQELRKRGYDEEIIRRHYESMDYGRIIDATWEEYYQMFKQGIKPPMRYADESELYDNPDALFGDIKSRAVAHVELQEKLKSGEINFDDGFMTLD